jgi:hypothetical protein
LANPDKSVLERALDLSKNVLDQEKRDFGLANNPSISKYTPEIQNKGVTDIFL